MTSTTIEDQVALLMQGTEYGDDTLRDNMARELGRRLLEARDQQRPLRVYCGYDPTKPDLHLGHTLSMRKLSQFQEYGHDVTFLIGDYTSLVGDPSDKDKLRPRLSPEEIRANAETYAEQAFRILDRRRTRIRYNSEWLGKLTFADLIQLASNFTIQQFLARERFALRLDRGDPVYLHETLYGLMQGYDAVAQQADVQVGGQRAAVQHHRCRKKAAGGDGPTAPGRDSDGDPARHRRDAAHGEEHRQHHRPDGLGG